MRIVSGTLRGRPLSGPAPDDRSVRPTSDRARESLFNIIAHGWPEKLDGGRVLDLFAGTGAVGCEALSRGASFALFVENAAKSRAMIQRNIETLQLRGRTQIFRRDATRLGVIGTMAPFDLAFVDPPYGRGLGEQALAALLDGGWLKPDALVILEERSDVTVSLPANVGLLDERVMGQTVLRFLEVRAHE